MFGKIKVSPNSIFRFCKYSQKVAQPLRSKKAKASNDTAKNFVDLKELRAIGGSGGDGCISFLSLWSNEYAGPDGGDGGNGGHVIFEACHDVKDLHHVPTIVKANDGIKGANKDCHGKSAQNYVVKVPLGTIVRNNNGQVIGDLDREGQMFVAARGGAGGRGNHFFISDTEQAPKICEYGAHGEKAEYTIELRTMAHVGLIGFPNAGKSTLLRAISRARPKVAPYPFTTLKPYLGIVQYDDHEQIGVADLPGLIPESHKNRGLGIQFLKHAERCMALLYVLDASLPAPWDNLNILQQELLLFSSELIERPQLVIANKIDLPGATDNVERIKEMTDLPVLAISAKMGTNILEMLNRIRVMYDKQKEDNDNKAVNI